MNRQVVSRKLPSFKGREIAISDLHGDLDSYKALLEKIKYEPGKDRLFLLGDLVEKGPKNLELLHMIMEQTKNEEVYALMGNCDFVAKNFLFSYRLDFIKEVLLSRHHSLIHEMMEQLNLEPLSDKTDMDELAHILREHYLPELTFLNDLPHVYETPERIYVHAGLLDEKTYAPDFRFVLTMPLFGQTTKTFTKPVVVGHMPVSEYCRHKGDFNPRFHSMQNIYSIDGGNMVKEAGQLNAILFYDNITETESVDFLPDVRVIRTTHPENSMPFFIPFNHGEVKVLEKGEETSLVYSQYLNRKFRIDNSFLVDNKGTDFTNYEMPLHYGERVRLIQIYGSKAQVKKQGVLGWTHVSNLQSINPIQDADETNKAAL